MVLLRISFCVIFLHTVCGYHLYLHRIDGEMVVHDVINKQPFCFPQDLSKRNPLHSRGDTGIGSQVKAESWIRNIARVVCRSLHFTHVENLFRVRSSQNGQHLGVRCRGYEPLISHCVEYPSSLMPSTPCKHLFGIRCGMCSKSLIVQKDLPLEIKSPGYPEYSDGAVCSWTLQANFDAQFTLDFNYFNLPEPNENGECGSSGVVEVSIGVDNTVSVKNHTPTNTTIAKMCGNTVPNLIKVNARTVIVRLSSGMFYPRPVIGNAGFRLLVMVAPLVLPSVAVKDTPSSQNATVAAIVMGVLVLLLLGLIIAFILRRLHLIRHRANQRKRMLEHNAMALTDLLVANIENHTKVGGFRGGDKMNNNHMACRTNSCPTHNPEQCPKCPSSAPSSAPPIPPSLPPHLRSNKQHNPSYEVEASHYEPPLYLELEQTVKTTYVKQGSECSSNASTQVIKSADDCQTPIIVPPHPPSEESCSSCHSCYSNYLRPKPVSSSRSPSRIHNSTLKKHSVSSFGSSVSLSVGSVSPHPSDPKESTTANIFPFTDTTQHTTATMFSFTDTTQNTTATAHPNAATSYPNAATTDPTTYPTAATTCPTAVTTHPTAATTNPNAATIADNINFRPSINNPTFSSPSRIHTSLICLTPIHSSSVQHSRSCSDVFSAASLMPQVASDELVKSEPSLSKDRRNLSVVWPVLCRVSNVYLWPLSSPDPSSPIQRLSTTLAPSSPSAKHCLSKARFSFSTPRLSSATPRLSSNQLPSSPISENTREMK